MTADTMCTLIQAFSAVHQSWPQPLGLCLHPECLKDFHLCLQALGLPSSM